MSERHDLKFLRTTCDIASAPTERRACDDFSFGLPTVLYVGTLASYLAFLAVMAVSFQSREMVLPMVIFVTFIAMLFGTPAMWAFIAPDSQTQALSWLEFMRNGVDTWTGPISGREAAVQVMILPVLILCWGIAMVTIAALI